MILSFVKIKPNSDKHINSSLCENILKMHKNDIKEDIIDSISDYVLTLTEHDPIQYINTFFSQINQTNPHMQNYEILSYDRNDTTYNIMLTNNMYNNESNKIEFDREKQFNLLASTLAQSYNNFKAIFGDVFILKIDIDSYDHLLLASNEKYDVKYDVLYKSFTQDDLIMSYYSILYIKIYSKNLNNVFIYERRIIDNLLNGEYQMSCIDSNILKIDINGDSIFCKLAKVLPNSHNHIMQTIKQDNSFRYNYLDNISNDDITKIKLY